MEDWSAPLTACIFDSLAIRHQRHVVGAEQYFSAGKLAKTFFFRKNENLPPRPFAIELFVAPHHFAVAGCGRGRRRREKKAAHDLLLGFIGDDPDRLAD